jgi:hypothetical protein
MRKIPAALIAFRISGFETSIYVQDSDTISGGKASGGGVSVSHSIGQPAYTKNTGTYAE